MVWVLIALCNAQCLHGMDSISLYELQRTGPEKKLPPITLPQIYHHFAEVLNSDVAHYIFSLQPGTDIINEDIFITTLYKIAGLKGVVYRMLDDYGYCFTVELLNRNLLRRNISICDITNEYNETALHYNSDTKATKLLLQVAGNNAWTLLAMKNIYGWTALHVATDHGFTEIVKLLLDAAGNNVWALLTAQSDSHRTVLHLAALKNHIKAIKLFLDTATNNTWELLTIKNQFDDTALHLAAREGHIEPVKLLLDAADNQIQALMNIRNKDGKTALDIATPKAKEIMQQYLQK